MGLQILPAKYEDPTVLCTSTSRPPVGDVHVTFQTARPPRSGDVLRGSTRTAGQWPDDGDGVERPLLGLLSVAVTGDCIV